MLTDDQARRFCGCRDCYGSGVFEWLDFENDRRDAPCKSCSGTGIDTAKRAELDELLRAAKEQAWQRGTTDAYPARANPYAKGPTGEHCPHPGRNGKHELFVSPSGSYCRACGYRENPTDG